MKNKSLHSRLKLYCALTLMAGLVTGNLTAQAQLIKNYATQAISHSDGSPFSFTYNVPDFAKASDGNDTTLATLHSNTTLGVTNTSYVEVGFTADVPDGTTLYIPVQDDPNNGLLSTLAGGSIGSLLTGLFGSQSFQVAIKTSAGSPVVTYNSANNGTRVFSQGTFNFVKDATGKAYITFKAKAGFSYRRIRVTALTGGLVTADYILKVEDAFYFSGTDTPCSPLVTTAFDAQGLSLSLLNGNGDPVKNIERAIDTDTTNFSKFGYGTVNVGLLGSISQDVYFSNLSKAGDQVKIKFRVPSNLLSLGVLDNINITAYRNDTVVTSTNLSSILSLQALGIVQLNLGSNIPATVQVPLAINAQFNKVRITYTVLVGANLDQYLELYGVDRVPPAPTVNMPAGVSCPATELHLAVSSVATGISYKWYNSSNVVVSTDTFYNATVPANGVTEKYYVTASGCAGKESIGTEVSVIGNTANCVSVSPVSFLQGTFDANVNRNRDVTPGWAAILAANATSQPYNTPVFGYNGTEAVSPAIFTSTAADNDVLDWMLLELKDSAGTMIDRKAVLVLENGNIANTDKTQPVVLKANTGKYHLTIRHRNHLGLSSNLITYTAGQNIFDFTTATDAQLYGDANAFAVVNGKTQMIAGNANSNPFISYTGSGNDRAIILNLLNGNNSGMITGVYSTSDLNLNGSVYYTGTGNDRAIILNTLGGNVNGFVMEQTR